MKDKRSVKELQEKFSTDLVSKVKLLDVTINSIIIHNSNGEIIYVNNAGCRMRGYSREEILKMHMFDLIAPGYIDFAKQQFEILVKKGFAEFEITQKRRDGTEFITEVRSNIIEINNEKMFLDFSRDITERKKMENELRESEERFRNFALLSPVGIFLADAYGCYQYVNRRWCEISGLSPLEASGEGWLKGVAPDDRERIHSSWNQFIQTDGKWIAEFRFRDQADKVTWVHSIVTPLHDEQGKITGFLGTNSDITELKNKEADTKKAQEELQTIFNSSPILVFYKDKNNVMIRVNTAYAKALKLDKSEIEGKDCSVIFPMNADKYWLDDIEVINTGKPKLNIIEPMETTDGLRIVCTDKVPYFDGKGNIIGIIGFVMDITEKKQGEEKLKENNRKLQKTLEGTINALAVTTENRDPYTAGHQRRVADLAFHIGREMGLPEEQVQGLKFAGMVHDIGKISIPLEILNKPGKLSVAEFTLIKGHSQVGYEILKDIEFGWPIAQIVLQHHERINGSGYPKNISNGDILLESKILGVADVVEAMASDRPYRAALGIDVALAEVNKKKGQLYDSQIVDICNKLFKEKGYKLD